jgi:HTH-type transcriptional regulator/antitoxin MqsA
MYPKKCAECGGEVVVSKSPIPFEIRGMTVAVEDIEHGLCSACAEVYLSLAATEELQKRAVRMVKQAKGLLPQDEIKQLRHSLGLSQAAFEDLLGVGPKTVIRWEKGTVFQSATADRLMRLLQIMPSLAGVLASESLYAQSATCAPRPIRQQMSRNWQVRKVQPPDLKVVTDENAAAA